MSHRDEGNYRHHRADVSPEERMAESEVQMQYLQALLDTCNNRRAAMDSRGMLVSTIGLALVGFLLTQSEVVFADVTPLLQKMLTGIILLPAFLSVYFSLRLTQPIKDGVQWGRGRRSLSYIYHIPDQSAEEYHGRIRKLTLDSAIEESTLHIHGLAEVLRERYDVLSRACACLYCALALLFAAVLSQSIWAVLK